MNIPLILRAKTISLSYIPYKPATDNDTLIAFLTSETWPFHVVSNMSEAEARRRIDEGEFTGDVQTFWIVEDGERIGLIRLEDYPSLPSIDLRLREVARGRGIGTAALVWLTDYVFIHEPKVYRIEASTRIDNLAMQRAFVRVGYTREAHYRHAWPTSEAMTDFLDSYGYGITRPDWEQQKARSPIEVRSATSGDTAWAVTIWRERWESEYVISRGVRYNAGELPALIAWVDGERAGVATYHFDTRDGCELVTLDAVQEGIGVGSALMGGVEAVAQETGVERVWLITSNDNTPALRFYQKRGYRMVAIYLDAISEARKLKPEIPRLGLDDIPLQDEIELEKRFS